jgi:hypothetical protein
VQLVTVVARGGASWMLRVRELDARVVERAPAEGRPVEVSGDRAEDRPDGGARVGGVALDLSVD